MTQKWFEARERWSSLSADQSRDALKTLAAVRQILEQMGKADVLFDGVLNSETAGPVVVVDE